MVETFKAATARYSTLKSDAGRLDAEIAALRDEEKQCRDKLAKLFEGDVEKEFAQEDRGRIVRLAARDADDDAGVPPAGDRSQDRPASGLITESFRFLSRKQIAGRADPHRPGDFRHHPLRQRGARAVERAAFGGGEADLRRSRCSGAWRGLPTARCPR